MRQRSRTRTKMFGITKKITNRITNKKKKIMKKIILTVVAAMALTTSFAETQSKNSDKRFDMNCDIYRLSEVLGLNDEQMDKVEAIHETFTDDMQTASEVQGMRQRHMIHQAVRKDAREMHRVLTEEQFRDYMRILGVTLRNRHL